MKKKQQQNSNRLVYLDILNIIAIVAVLFMHHDFGVHYFSHGRAWFFDLALKVIMYFCIPVFLMCTGSTLLGYKDKYDTRTFFKKRFLKIFIPMVAWFIITGIIRVFFIKNLTIPTQSLSSFFSFFMNGGVCDYYWYLFLIIGIYLTIPIISPLSKKENKSLLKYAILTLFIFNMVLPNIASLLNINYNQNLPLEIGAYMIYPLIGYYISKYNISSQKKRIILYCLGGCAIIYQFISTALLSYNADTSVLTTLGYTEFATALYASAIFCFVRNMKHKVLSDPKLQSVLKTLSGCSFGIYLSHYLVMYFERKVILEPIHISNISAISRFLCPFLTYALCVGLVLILKKIPVLRRIVP